MVGNDKVKRMGKDSNKSHTQNYVKQKILLPTLKERQRYLVYQALFKNDADNKLLTQEFKFINDDIIRQCSFLLGVFDGAAAGIMGVKFNNQKLRGIIRVDNKYVDKLKICLGLIKTVKIHTNDQPIIIDTISVSGILNKAEEKII
jgi:RNase P/RNase MRP subunit POP5